LDNVFLNPSYAVGDEARFTVTRRARRSRHGQRRQASRFPGVGAKNDRARRQRVVLSTVVIRNLFSRLYLFAISRWFGAAIGRMRSQPDVHSRCTTAQCP
jgi:hypothetical protein